MVLTKQQDLILYLFLVSVFSLVFYAVLFLLFLAKPNFNTLKNKFFNALLMSLLILGSNLLLVIQFFSFNPNENYYLFLFYLFLAPLFISQLLYSKNKTKNYLSLITFLLLLVLIFFTTQQFLHIRIDREVINICLGIYFIINAAVITKIIISLVEEKYTIPQLRYSKMSVIVFYSISFVILPIYFVLYRITILVAAIDVISTFFLISSIFFLLFYSSSGKQNLFHGTEGDDIISAFNKINQSNFESYIKNVKPYLNPHIKIADIAKEFGTNRSYLSNFINFTYKMNFTTFINICRYEELEFIKNQPQYMGIEERELIYLAGFSSYNSYKNIKEKIDMFDVRIFHK